jgi:hypothetical protein
MKIKIDNYNFDKTSKTITFTDYGTIELNRILGVINTTTGNIIYTPIDSTLNGTVSGNVLTLDYNTSSMNNSDKLLIYYDNSVNPLTATELRAVPLHVVVDNQIDLTTVQTTLANILTKVTAIDVNTDTVETKLSDILTEIDANGTINHNDLLSVISELQGIDANTDGLEASLLSIITNTTGKATEAKQDTLNALVTLIEGYYKAEDSPSVSGDKGLPLLAMRQQADTTSTNTDGDYTLLKIDEEGRLKVATKPASFTLISSNITASAQTAFCDTSRASNVMISMVATSLVGHNVTFEGSIDSTTGSDGNWFGIQAVRSNANTIETSSGVLASTPAYAWEASVNGLSFIRVRATAHTSGTATWKFQRGSYATEPIPAIQTTGTQAVSLTGTTITAISAGTTAIGDVGLQARANATGAPTPVAINSPATPVGQIIKAGAGRVFSFHLSNSNASPRFLKVFNATAVTMGTTSALYEIEIPPNRVPVTVSLPLSAGATTGFAVAVTGARGLTDNTAITLNDVTGFATFA